MRSPIRAWLRTIVLFFFSVFTLLPTGALAKGGGGTTVGIGGMTLSLVGNDPSTATSTLQASVGANFKNVSNIVIGIPQGSLKLVDLPATQAANPGLAVSLVSKGSFTGIKFDPGPASGTSLTLKVVGYLVPVDAEVQYKQATSVTATKVVAYNNATAKLTLTYEAATTVAVGQATTATITVTNLGPDAATAVTVTSDIPDTVSVTAVTADNAAWVCSSNSQVTCTAAKLEANETVKITVTYVASEAGSYSSKATVTANAFNPDTTLSVSTVNYTVTPASDAVEILYPVLQKTAVIGDTVDYVMTVTNNMTVAAKNVAIKQTYQNVTVVAATASAGTVQVQDNTVVVVTDQVAAAQTITIYTTVTYTTAQAASYQVDVTGDNIQAVTTLSATTTVVESGEILEPANTAVVNGTVSVLYAVSQKTVSAVLKVDDQLVAVQTPATANFNWDSNTVADGDHTLAVTVTAQDGSELTHSITVTVANQSQQPAGTITSPKDQATVTGTTAVTYVVARDTVSATLSVDGRDRDSQDPATGSFSYDSTVDADGPHLLKVTAVSASGVVTSDEITVNVVNDVQQPAGTITSPKDQATVSGTLEVTYVVAKDTASATFSVDGQNRDRQDPATGSFTYDSTADADGPHLIAVTAVSVDGTTSTSKITVNVANQTNLPAGTITSPQDGAGVSGTLDITYVVGRDTVSATFSVDGRDRDAQNPATGSFSYDSTLDADGPHLLKVTALSASGTSTSSEITVNVSNQAPLPAGTITSPQDAAVVSGSIDVTYVVAKDTDKATLAIDGQTVEIQTPATGVFTVDTTPFADGQHSLKITAVSVKGNVTTSAITVLFANHPATITSPQDGATVSGTVKVTYVTAPDTISATLMVDGNEREIQQPATGVFHYDSTVDANGTHTIKVMTVAKDGAIDVGAVTIDVKN